MTPSENYRRALRFDHPERIPLSFHFNDACWSHYPQDALKELMADHPMLFPDGPPTADPYVPCYAPWMRKDQPHTDSWGCVWSTNENGISGVISHHPLATWDDFESFIPPDPETQNGRTDHNWADVERGIRHANETGGLSGFGLQHGHTFLQLTYIRGYENTLFDMADGEPRLDELLGMIGDFNDALVARALTYGPALVRFPEDLGMQVGPMLSPTQFRRYIKPIYQRMMNRCREAGAMIHMHCDGDLRDLAEDLIDGGVEALNLQDLVNGIDWIAANLKGRVCIDLDIDRQSVAVRGTPAEVDALIRREVETLGDPAGGLMLNHGAYVGMPLENMRAVMDAMERYSTYYSE